GWANSTRIISRRSAASRGAFVCGRPPGSVAGGSAGRRRCPLPCCIHDDDDDDGTSSLRNACGVCARGGSRRSAVSSARTLGGGHGRVGGHVLRLDAPPGSVGRLRLGSSCDTLGTAALSWGLSAAQQNKPLWPSRRWMRRGCEAATLVHCDALRRTATLLRRCCLLVCLSACLAPPFPSPLPPLPFCPSAAGVDEGMPQLVFLPPSLAGRAANGDVAAPIATAMIRQVRLPQKRRPCDAWTETAHYDTKCPRCGHISNLAP
ncbi:hypothetical protein EJ04DRAFT_592894, partial [Polyplosphaeria fusca]